MNPDEEYLAALFTLKDTMKQFIGMNMFVANKLEKRVLDCLSDITVEIARVQRVMKKQATELLFEQMTESGRVVDPADSPNVTEGVQKKPKS